MHDDPSVTNLVTRAANGDKQAWDALVDRYAPLIWSICCRNQLSRAHANDVSHSVWLLLADQLTTVRHPAALSRWLAATTQRECGRVRCAAGRPQAGGQVLDAGHIPDEPTGIAEQELAAADRNAALRAAFKHLPPRCQQLIAMLTQDPPVPYAEISDTLGIPVDSIERSRGHCLDKLRRHPAITALINAGAPSR